MEVVLVDANVLYSRVLCDYLLYAAEIGVCAVAWSQEILDETTEHLCANLPGFTAESAARLTGALLEAFPYSLVEPSTADNQRLEDWPLPDEDDRHAIAAALTAEATIICTNNTRDFPGQVMDPLGIAVMTPDALLARLVESHPAPMLRAHRMSVAAFRGATDAVTLAALRRAGAAVAADRLLDLLTTPEPGAFAAARRRDEVSGRLCSENGLPGR